MNDINESDGPILNIGWLPLIIVTLAAIISNY